MMNYGNVVAGSMEEGIAKVGPGDWTRLNARSSNQDTTDRGNLANRKWIELQFRSIGALAISYTNKNNDGTFSKPNHNAHIGTIYPANSIIEKPIGENIMMWGRLVNKANASVGGAKINVVEFK